MFEFEAETLAQGDRLCGDVLVGGEVGEQEQHGERIVEIAQGVNKGGVSLLDNVVQLHLRDERLLQACGIASLSTAEGTANLLCNSLVLAELVEEGLMEEVLDVLGVVEGSCGGRALGNLLLVAGFAGVDT